MFSRINDFHNWLTERKSFYGVACATVEGSGAGVVYWQKKDVKRNILLCVKLQKRKSVSSSQKSNPQNLMHMNSHPRNPKCIVECNFQKKLHHAVSACCIRIVYWTWTQISKDVLPTLFCLLLWISISNTFQLFCWAAARSRGSRVMSARGRCTDWARSSATTPQNCSSILVKLLFDDWWSNWAEDDVN